MKKVPFNKIKPGAFFRIEGKALWQRRRDAFDSAQVVTGQEIGRARYPGTDALVTSVNATIVEEK
ncbi:hypothetical protein IMZ48_26160 [Candidatus Bathyarchaeota archaeon]|nr:hypothetical protein [Candidatus Bathyarchaeota archaeon]